MAATTDTPDPSGDLTRRHALELLGTAGVGAAAIPLLSTGTAAAATSPSSTAFHITPDSAGAPPVQGLHLTFGADPSREMYASWSTATPVRRPRVSFGTLEHGHGDTVAAETRS